MSQHFITAVVVAVVFASCTATPADGVPDSGVTNPDAGPTRPPRARPPDPTREELEWHQVGATASHLRWSRSARLDSYSQIWEAHPTFDRPIGPDELRADFAPVVVGDAIIVAGYNAVASLAQADGSVRWLMTNGAQGDVAVVGERAIFWENSRRGPVALALADGQDSWARPDLGADRSGGAVVVVGDTAFISARDNRDGGGGVLLALDAATGATKWTVPFNKRPWEPTVADGRVIVVDASARVRAFRQDDGAALWEASAGEAPPTDTARLATLVADGRVVSWSDAAAPLVALDATDGSELWRASPSSTMPVSAYGLVFTAEDRALVARDLATGGEWWRQPIDGWPVLVLDGLVLVNTLDAETNQVRFLDAETGAASGGAIMEGVFYDAVASCGRLVGGVRNRSISVRMFGSTSTECRPSAVY